MSKRRNKTFCVECGASFYNRAAHMEECPGPVGFEQVEFQCGRCLRTNRQSEWCHNRWMGRVSPGAYRAPRPNPL